MTNPDKNSSSESAANRQTVLDNLALANQIFNDNLAQQNAIQNRQAMFYLQLAAVAKSIELVLSIDPKDPEAAGQLKMCRELIESFKSNQ